MKHFGIVGAGIISASHKKALLNNPECKIAAICDINLEKAEQLAEGTEARVYSDYKEMCWKEKLDAVILNLPHFLHKEVSIYFLENKVAVLVEKPMANTVEECDAMIEAVERNHTPLAVGHVQKYLGCYRKLKELMKAGELGELCSFTETRNIDYFTNRPKWFLSKKQAGGGIIMNYGAHSLDKLFYTIGSEVEKLFAVGSNLLTDDDVEASAQMMLRFANGVSAVCTYHGCHTPNQYDGCFYFTEAAAQIRYGSQLWIAKGKNAFEYVEPDDAKDMFEFQLEEFLKYLDGEESEVVTPEYGRRVISVLEEAYRQIEQK